MAFYDGSTVVTDDYLGRVEMSRMDVGVRSGSPHTSEPGLRGKYAGQILATLAVSVVEAEHDVTM